MTTTQHTFSPVGVAALALAVGACFLTINDASAKGCNGVVDQWTWGCAAWDNNNGPQYPHYKAPKTAPAPARPAPAPQVQRPVIAPNSSAGIVANNGGRVIGQNGAGVVGQNGAGVVGQNGANFQGR
jgi:hypothetical protein